MTYRAASAAPVGPGLELARVDFSRLDRNRVLVGGVASILLIISLLFLPWYSLSTPSRAPGNPSYDPNAFICGTGDFSCTGFETFPIMRWLLIAGALSRR